MYTKQVPFTDLNGKPRNLTVHFNLFEREVFKLLKQFQEVFAWQDKLRARDVDGETPTEEVVEFYNNFEDILLTAYGVPSDDGLTFDKSGRYGFEDSALFNACMLMFVTDPTETGKLIDALMPTGLQEIVKTADANLVAAAAEEGISADREREIERLREQLRVAQAAVEKPAE